MFDKRLPIICFGLILCAIAYWQFVPTEAGQIKNMLLTSATLVERQEKEHPFEALRRAREIAAHAADNVSVRAEFQDKEYVSSHNRKEIEDAIVSLRGQLNSLSVTVRGLSVDIRNGLAYVQADVMALGSMPGADGQFLEHHRAELVLEKQRGEWLVSKVHSVQIPNNPTEADT